MDGIADGVAPDGAAGLYTFGNLLPGEYRVTVVLPGGYVFTAPFQGGNAALDSNMDPLTGASDCIELSSGEEDTTVDAGAYVPATLGDYVWEDVNGNGQQDDGDTGIAGVTVTLTGTDGLGNAVSLSTTTDADGTYLFSGLAPGSYQVTFSDLPAGMVFTVADTGDDATDSDADRTTGATGWYTLTSGENELTVDAGAYTPACIGDLVWEDTDADGIQDAGETGLSGVTVTLYLCGSDEEVATTVTGPDGTYEFCDLAPGDYYLVFGQPGDYEFSDSDQGSDDCVDSDADGTGRTACTTLTSGENDICWDTGLYEPASIGDLVWNDLNGNGVQDDGEPPVEGAVVSLADCDGNAVVDVNGNAVLSQTTGPDGLYTFGNLLPGEYRVTVVLPGGYVFTAPFQGGDPAKDSNMDPLTGASDCIELSSGEEDTTVDAGAYVPATLGDYVWEDVNGNGQQDDGDTGIAGVTVTLTGTDGLGNAVSLSTTTDADGAYLFSDLVPGSYQVTFSGLPAGMVFTVADTGADATDSDADRTTGATGWYTLTSGENELTVDAGAYTPACIGDLVWEDTDADGIQNAGETGLSGVTVTLYLCGSDEEVATTVTGPDGTYEFCDLAPGEYYLVFGQPGDYEFSDSDQGSDDCVDSDADGTGRTACTTLTSGENDICWDTGLYEPASIGDLVWNDLNGNGVQDAGEPPVEGAVVSLTDCDGNAVVDVNGNAVLSQTTGADGLYTFGNLLPGEYRVTVVLPGGYVFTAPFQGGNAALDSNMDPLTGASDCIELSSGEEDTTVDAGAYVPATLGDYVWEDVNGNGQQDDGDTGIAGVTVTLTGTDGLGNAVSLSTTTDADGAYLFSGLAPGSYQVTFSGLPAGMVFTVADTGADVTDSDADRTTGATGWYTLTSGENELTVDAGAFALAQLGDYVWEDLNANGQQDDGTTGIAGVTVTLTGIDVLGNAVNLTATTDGNGMYLFDNLVPGSYQATFSDLPAGMVFTAQDIGADATDSDADRTTGATGFYELTSGERELTVDAGAYRLAALGDYVWKDEDGNGLQDSGEPGMENVVVTLYQGDVSYVASTTTDASGKYEFTALVPGDYYVVFTAPTGYGFTLANQASDDVMDSDANKITGQTQTVTLSSGETNHTVDAGLIPDTCGIMLVKTADKQYVGVFEQVTYNYSLYNTATVPLTVEPVWDDNGTPDYPADDFQPPYTGGDANNNGLLDPLEVWTYAKTTFPPYEMCQVISNNLVPVGTQIITENLANGNIKVTFIQTIAFNDNSYGVNTDPSWGTRIHKFSDLTGSDNAQFVFLNGAGQIVLDAKVDYITAAPLAMYPSGYGTLGVTGGEGTVNVGNASDVVKVTTSLSDNLNQSPAFYVNYLTNSPSASDPNKYLWEYRIIYAVEVKGSMFGESGFGSVRVPSVHNSPNKGGNVVDPKPCEECVKNTATVTAFGCDTQLSATDDATVCVIVGPLGSIGDRVWLDLTGDGAQDDFEPGLAGVGLTLYADINGDNVVDFTKTTVTDGDGLYTFTWLPAGTYQVVVNTATLPAGLVQTYDLDGLATPDVAVASLDSAQNRTDVDFGYVSADYCGPVFTKTADNTQITAGMPVTYAYTVSNGCSKPMTDIMVRDDNGTPVDKSDDFVVGTVPVLASGQSVVFFATRTLPLLQCMTINDTNQQVGTLTTEILPSGDIKVTFAQSRHISDNTYGVNAVGYPKGHTFANLTGSDKAEFRFVDATGAVKLDFIVDYVSAASKALYPSGYGTLGVTGGDGKMITGSAASVLSVRTSISDNLNQSPAYYGYTTNSPPEPNANWNYQVTYTVVVSKNAFGSAGFGGVAVPSVHNSPSKQTFNELLPGPCDLCVRNIATLRANIDDSPVVATASETVCIFDATGMAHIGDLVWKDKKGDGVRQPKEDPPIPGVTVQLLSCSGTLLESAVTDAKGLYKFNVWPGSYKIRFVLPAGYKFTQKDKGADDSKDSDADPVTGETVCITAAAGKTYLTWDAGLVVTPLLKAPVRMSAVGSGSAVEVMAGDVRITSPAERPQTIRIAYEGGTCAESRNSQQSSQAFICVDDLAADIEPVRIVAFSADQVVLDSAAESGIPDVHLGDELEIDSLNAGESQLGNTIGVVIFNSAGVLVQQMIIDSSWSQPIQIGDTFGAIRIVDLIMPAQMP